MPLSRFFTLSALDRRVFLVAVAGLLPVTVLTCMLLLSNARTQKDRILSVTEDAIIALMSAVDAELKSDVAALDALAASPRLARGDFAGVREEALELLVRRENWLNVVVLDRERQYVNARVPTELPLPAVNEPELVAEVFEKKEPIAGQVIFSPVLQQHAVEVLIPYVRNGEVKYVVAAVVRPDSFLDLLELENVASRGVIAVIDRKNRVVARSLNSAQWIGKQPSLSLLDMLEAGDMRGSMVTRTLEGVPVYTVFRRSLFSGWSVAVGIERSAVDGPLLRAYLLLGGAVVFSVLLGLIAANLVGRTIVKPMAELEGSAASVGRGEAPTMPDTRLAEVRRVAVALGKAHDERMSSFQREREARVAAENASKAKDEFLAMLGHELRNPLAAITTAAHLVERQRGALDPATATATDIIARQARHLSRMTDDLLDAGRVILGKIALARAPVDLAAAVSGALEGLRGTGRLGNHEVRMALETVWVFADSTRVEQIVANLLTNAIKYTPAGGRIVVETHRRGNEAVFIVTDSGIGLEAELLPRAFDLFVQGERGLDRSQGGLGIGLTLVRRLAELHGGSADAHSEGSGRGATFTVRLPAIEAPSDVKPAQLVAATQPRRQIALIEDNEDARASLKMLLEFEGHTVHEAGDGTSGVELLTQEQTIEVAFVDIGLPGMSGYQVAREVRARIGSRVRLVAMSGYGSENDVEQGLAAGFDAYIVKPAEIEALTDQIAQV